MNAIAGFSQLLLRDVKHPLSRQQTTWTRQIVHGAAHLLDLINETIDIGRIESGHLALEHAAVPLASLVHECVGMTGALANERGAVHAMDGFAAGAGSIIVQADRKRLKQVLINLISNAIKYNLPGGWVTISAESEPAFVEISVSVFGAGISAEDCARLFTPFERLGAPNTPPRKVRASAWRCHASWYRRWAGDIGVSSAPGSGSRFWVRLPHGIVGSAAGTIGDDRQDLLAPPGST